LKHADKDPTGSIEFDPFSNEMFLLYSAAALARIGEPLSMEEDATSFFVTMSRPELIHADSKKKMHLDAFEKFNSIPKGEFLEVFSIAWGKGLLRGHGFITPSYG
jgi:hypothetical protein